MNNTHLVAQWLQRQIKDSSAVGLMLGFFCLYVSYVPIKMARLWWGDNYMDLPLNNVATSKTSLYSKLELCKRAFRIVGFSLFYYINL